MLYSLAIYCWQYIQKLASLFNKKAKLRVEGLRSWQIPAQNRDITKPCVWIHCASLGEFEQGRPLIEALKNQYPHCQILLTFYSSSGYEIRKNYPLADMICYLPDDLKSTAQKFYQVYRPNLAVLVKYEFWRNFINEFAEHKVPIISVSSIFREDQHFFKVWGKSARVTLKKISYFFVQNEISKDLLHKIGLENVSRVGDTRFDRVADIARQIKQLDNVAHFVKQTPTCVAGSVWEEDMQILIATINSEIGLKYIIAPHEINTTQIEKWESQMLKKCVRFADLINDSEADVLIIDNIGMLSSLYQYGTVAYIGGAFGKGLHNILEAVTFGLPVFFGNKNYNKFKEAVDLLSLQTAQTVENEKDLTKGLVELLANEALLKKKNVANLKYIEQNKGATENIMRWLHENIKL